MLHVFSEENFYILCDDLARRDAELQSIIATYGYPPLWTRENTFETLVHIILEQQVSLSSALAALNKLRERITIVTPEKFLSLSDAQLKSCYFSRQKISYVRSLATALQQKQIQLKEFETLPDAEVRQKLITLKGIGNWTIDVYLMFVLQRADIFPVGDLAAVNALKQIKNLSKDTEEEEILEITSKWQPYRSVGAMLLWHHYLSLRAKISPSTRHLS